VTFTPTKEQLAIIDSNTSAIVVAGPGRGKTATAIAAADAWATRFPAKPVLFTSFSNTAVRRISEAAGLGMHRASLAFRTFHSVAFEILVDYGRYVGMRRPATALDKPAEHLIALEETWPDDLQAYAKARRAYALKTGCVAFADMVPLASLLLDASPTLCRAVQRRFSCVVIDEFQDTTMEQAAFLKLLGDQSRMLAFGDPNQMIYESDFAAAEAQFQEFAAWKRTAVSQFEGRNYRCAATDMLDFAEAVLHGQRYTGAHKNVQCTGIYENQRRAYIAMRCNEIWKTSPGTIGIIAPSVKVGRELAALLRAPDKGVKVPIPVHAAIEVDASSADAFRLAAFAANDYARAPSNDRRHQLAVALTGLERETRPAGSIGVARLVAIEKLLGSASKKASALRDLLAQPPTSDIQSFATQFASALVTDASFATVGHAIEKTGIPTLRPVTTTEQFEHFRAERSVVGFHGPDYTRARTTMLSMHRAKGREFDHVVVIADGRAHPKDTSIGELRRLHYVSCTRARKSLSVLWNSAAIGEVLAPVLN
jgi:superfamily I DNA/RNA helicase